LRPGLTGGRIAADVAMGEPDNRTDAAMQAYRHRKAAAQQHEAARERVRPISLGFLATRLR